MRTRRRSRRTRLISAIRKRPPNSRRSGRWENSPSLRDEASDRLIPESSVDHRISGPALSGRDALPSRRPGTGAADALSRPVLRSPVHAPMQKIITDRMRPAGQNDPYGVEEARRRLTPHSTSSTARWHPNTWAMGDTFTHGGLRGSTAAVLHNNNIMPLAGTHPNADRYLKRLMELPSYARALEEAKPYFHLFPRRDETRHTAAIPMSRLSPTTI